MKKGGVLVLFLFVGLVLGGTEGKKSVKGHREGWTDASSKLSEAYVRFHGMGDGQTKMQQQMGGQRRVSIFQE